MGIMKKLIEHHFMDDHIEEKLEKDRSDYLDQRLLRKTRVFKNHTETNANQLRKETQLRKLQMIR